MRKRTPRTGAAPAPAMTIVLPLIRGRCRWCLCTRYTPCVGGCGWADEARTLCTSCVRLDQLVQTARGRQALSGFVQYRCQLRAEATP